MATKKTVYEAPAPASDKKKALQTALAQIDKNFGKGTVMRLGDRPEMNVEAIPTGSLALDAALGIGIFVLVYGRMLEIYILTSLAPIPMATISNREVGQMGQNYLRSLFAVGFQGMLILVCVAIYAVLIQGIATGGDPIGAIWGIVGYTVLLCFMLFKTGSIARSIFNAH